MSVLGRIPQSHATERFVDAEVVQPRAGRHRSRFRRTRNVDFWPRTLPEDVGRDGVARGPREGNPFQRVVVLNLPSWMHHASLWI